MSHSSWTIRLDEIPEEGLEVALTESPSALDLDSERCSWKGRISWAGTLQRFGADVYCAGRLEAQAVVACSRCLCEMSVDLSDDLTFTFAPAPRSGPGERESENEIESDEAELYFYTDGCLNLREPVRDCLIMAVPVQPVCRENCKGLCPHCGADLNEGPCGCEETQIDPRWEALARFRGSMTSENG